MKKSVMLAIQGLHKDSDGENGSISQEVAAQYYEKDGVHYLFYQEEQESSEASRSRIKFKPGRLELVRQGAVAARMVFEEQKSHRADYRTPYGTIPIDVDTEKIAVEKKEGEIRVTVEYGLETEGRRFSDSRLVLCIREKKSRKEPK